MCLSRCESPRMPDKLQAAPELRESFEAHHREATIQNIELGCFLGMILMPAGVALDYFVYRNQLGAFFLLRILCSGLIGLFWLVVRSPFGPKHYRKLGLLLAMFPAFFISWMIALTEGASSTYYAGLNLVLLVVGFILHWTVRESVVAVGAVMAMYLGACYVHDPGFVVTQQEAVANNLYFLVLTGVIVVAGSGYHYRLRFREYALLFELDRSRNQLEENHRKLKELDEVKSRFFANISHELRTPLTLLLAPLDALAAHAGAGPAPDGREMLATMQANGMRLLKLINDLLDLVRLESGRMVLNREPLALEPFVAGLLQSVRKVAQDKRIELAAEVPADLPPIFLDPDKLEKILLNLLFNALKFTPAGGRVTVRARREADRLVLAVRDTGMGIAPAQLPNVFSRFWQADTSAQRKYQGMGIGLALVKELTEAHGGEVQIASELNRGTTFTLRIPWEEAPAQLAPTGPAPAPEPANEPGEEWLSALYRRAELFPAMTAVQESLKPIELLVRDGAPKLLVADDEPDMLRFLRNQLQGRYQVIEAVDGNQAVEKAAQFLPEIILLDMMMPEKDGLQVCRELRQRTATQRIPIVLLTARADEETKLAALAAGASDFLAKPFSTTELHVRLKNLADSHQYQRRLARQNQILEATLQELQDTQTMLVQSEKLASLGRMSAGIIHEINNPLNFAKTAVHLLKRQADPKTGSDEAELRASMLDDIDEGIERVRIIVSDLRAFTHPNLEAFEEVSLTQAISSTLRFLSHEWKEKVQVEVAVEPPATVWGNRHQIVQVLINLMQNSIAALAAPRAADDPPRIALQGSAYAGGYRLSVRDNGPGIAAEHLANIFEPFFTTKEPGEGVGLGLSICYRIMQSHGGQITVRSEPGQGCEFLLDFPGKKDMDNSR